MCLCCVLLFSLSAASAVYADPQETSFVSAERQDDPDGVNAENEIAEDEDTAAENAAAVITLNEEEQSEETMIGGEGPEEKLTGESDEKSSEPSDEQQNAPAERTILLYICGADLESRAALATANLAQVLQAGFSAEDEVHVVVMTGGSEYWWLREEDCVIPDDMRINDFEDTSYNRVWEAKGADAKENPGKLVLLDPDGVSGSIADGTARYAWEENLSDPETLKAFINYGAENYPAKKYDLILWDHGGGAVDGFAYDEYSENGSMMSLPQILDAVSDNAVTAEGGRFDFIDFDACLMNSVEMNLALSDYTDYYIASAETEPGNGQDYRGWLDLLGEAPGMNTFALGTVLVDDYIGFYTDENGNETDYGTLAVVNTGRLMEAGFAEAISGLSDVLRTQINTKDENGEYLYYDELDSAKRSIQYAKPDTYYKDLGNLAGQLAVTNKEISLKNLDENGSYNKLNDYADVSSAILSMLNDPQIIYSRYTNNLVIGPEIQIDADRNLIYRNLAPSGMHIYYPAINDSDYIPEYLDAVSGALGFIKNEEAKNALSNYSKFIAQQALAVEIGFNVGFMLDAKEIPPSEVNYDSVKAYLDERYYEGTPTLWEERILPLIEYYSSEEEAVPWLNTVIGQQVNDHIQKDNISVRSNSEKSSFKVYIDNTGKRAVENVKAKVIAELPKAKEYIENDLRLGYYYEYHPDWLECSIRTVSAIQDTGDLDIDYNLDSLDTILDKYIKWYAKKSSVWNLEDPDSSVYALKDAEGGLHAVKVEEYNEDRLMAAVIYPNADTGKEEFGYLLFEPAGNEYVLSKIALGIQNGGDRFIPVGNLNGEVPEVTTGYYVSLSSYSGAIIPMSLTSFGISPENADRIRLVITDIGNVPDIQDTDGDGKPVFRRIVVSDIYQYESDITDKTRTEDLVDIEDVSVENVVYNGTEQGPKLVYNGTVLEEKKDYIWYKTDDAVACKNAGQYSVLLIGKGDYVGRTETGYSILPLETDPVISGIKNKTYTGKAITQDIKVRVSDGGINKTLKEKTDYTISYSRNTDAGTASVTVKGKGNYSFSKKEVFTINPKKVTPAVTLSKTSYTYNGESKKPSVTVKIGKTKLAKGQYAVTYDKGRTQAGKYKVTVSLKGNYKGTKEMTFTITPASIKSASLSYTSKKHTGKALKPGVTVKGKYKGKTVTLKKNRDYTVTYKNNKNPGTATVIIMGKGNYKGTIKRSFKITPKQNR